MLAICSLVVACGPEGSSSGDGEREETGSSAEDPETPDPDSDPDADPEDAPDDETEPAEPESVPRTFTVRNASEAPLLIDTYPGFRIASNEAAFPRFSCSAECGVCDFGECGCAPNSVSEVLPGETLELTWSGEYWEERPDECEEGCAIRRTAGEGAYTLSLDFGSEAVHEEGCSGSYLVGDVRTATIEFEHPAADDIELVLPPA